MPTTSGFSSAPVARFSVAYIIIASLIASATDTKYYFNILVTPHLLGSPYSGQWWRLLTWPLCYANSTEVLFAAMTVYQLRIVERIWGAKKLATFLLTTSPYTVLLPSLLLLILRPLTGYNVNHLPSGPTSIIFAVLAQYHAAIPYTYRYRISSSNANEADTEQEAPNTGITLTSKSTSYLLPCQLALSQLPGSLIPALVGWVVGYAWRAELLPTFPGRSWRVPGWLVGEGSTESGAGRGREQMEGLRRRMEEESEGRASAVEGASNSAGRRW